jgi:drug/metabolite transporter (DMT)-like permease
MKQLKGDLILLITAIIWGTSFVSQKLGMNYIEPFTFGASRFLLGAVVLVPVIIFFDKMNKKATKKQESNGRLNEHSKVTFKTKDLILGGILCGSALFLGASFQQWGILGTTAGKAGFITALYIVLVPIFGLFMNKKVNLLTWFGVALAIFGLYLLTIQEGFTLEKGDALVLVGTVFWALQIIFVDMFVDKVEGLKLSCIQFVTAGILSAIAAFIFETPEIGAIIDGSVVIIYTAVMVVGVAYTLQIIGQKYTSPTAAAIIMSLESVFAVISGAIFLNESMNTKEMLGCLIMFVAVVITQLKPEDLRNLLKKSSKVQS